MPYAGENNLGDQIRAIKGFVYTKCECVVAVCNEVGFKLEVVRPIYASGKFYGTQVTPVRVPSRHGLDEFPKVKEDLIHAGQIYTRAVIHKQRTGKTIAGLSERDFPLTEED